MSLKQLLNTVGQITTSESISPVRGLARHCGWQLRKALRRFPVELQIGASRIRVDQPSGVAALVNAMGEYDYNNMQLLRLVLSNTRGTFVDVGANIGAYTLVASEERLATVVSIEPHPETFRLLEVNVQLNHRSNVSCLNVALSNYDGEVRLTDKVESAINRMLGPMEPDTSRLLVMSRRADTVCSALSIAPDFVKIDVEGHERTVLEGFGKYEGLAKIMFVEGGAERGVREWMARAGYGGPFYCHIRKQVLARHKQRRPEDPVFVALSFLGQLRAMGFRIQQGVI